ncbi:molybdopterin converting factor subunit 1 [Parapedomonas caeni]
MHLLYFAWVRERIGLDAEALAPPATVTTVADLLDWLGRRSAGHAEAFADRTRLRVAVDQIFADMSTPVASAREIAIFPPVTGG